MTATASDLVIVYSGGTTNSNPNLSLGGEPSSQIIIGTMNNLFSNIESEEAETGKEDYRCFYIFNNNQYESFFNLKLKIKEEVSGGSNVYIGIKKNHETQRMTISSIPTSGRIGFSYEDSDIQYANWHSNIINFVNNVKNALEEIFESVNITVINYTSTIVLNIELDGDDDYRFHDLIETTNELNPTVTISMSRQVPGAPINYIHDTLESETTPPYDVVFSSSISTIEIGTIKPGEGLPVWIKRVTEEGTSPKLGDGFTLNISFNSIE